MKHKSGKHMTILVIQLNEPWKRVSAEVLGQNKLGGNMHLFKEGMKKGNLNLMYIQPSYFQSKSYCKVFLQKYICHPNNFFLTK